MEGKTKAIFLVFSLFATALCWKLVQVQIKNGQYYEALALGQQISFEEVTQKRGEIFLFKGNLPLAQTKKKNLIYIFPEKIKEQERTAEILGEILGEKAEDLMTIFQKGQIFRRELSDETLAEIKKAKLWGVYPDEILARSYPQGIFASDVIGFLNEAGEGQYGIEGYYNLVLKGEDGLAENPRSPFGYITLFLEPAKNSLRGGADIYLTLDYNIQYFAEKLLKEAKEAWDIDSGQIIVQEPATGKILALADFPDFDPSKYAQVRNLEIFLNDSVQKLFEPGSVFKPITMAAGLEEGLIIPETEYEDKGYVELGGPPIYNFQKRVWGKQTMTDVLEESINTGAVFVQQELGRVNFLNYIQKFGLFERTEIDLPGEVFSSNETLKNGYPRDFASASFGQGINITSLQLVRAFGAIANGGKLMRPYIVEKIVQSDGKEIKIEPQVQGEAISEKTSLKLTSMLVSVVENGSGRRAKISGYYIAGKTGTAQVPLASGGYSKDESIHNFVGYFPAFDPQFLIFIKLDNPKGVSTSEYSTVPFFRKLAKYIIDTWQIPPDYE